MLRERSREGCRIIVTFALLFKAALGFAQAVSPAEIKDPALRELQTTYIEDLQKAGQEIVSLHTEYPFYLSRKLDLDLAQQRVAEQRGLRFEHFNGKTVLAITGNYYASYATQSLSPERRARETYLNIVFPILKAVVPRFQNNRNVQGYAVEVSHHVRGKVMDVEMERPENLFVFLPQNAALKLLSAKDETGQQAALLEGQFLLNGDPVSVWLNPEGPPPAPEHHADASPPARESERAEAEVVSPSSNENMVPVNTKSRGNRAAPAPAPPPRDTSPSALAALEAVNTQTLAAITKDLGDTAHLVSYAPPAFIVFRQAIYLQLSMNTELSESAAGSRYKLAAMAFDDDIAHLVRPVMKYFKDEQQFDGVEFSTTVHLPAKASASLKSESVEYFFPFSALRCYEKYDCTGQQLIDAGVVLINGERVSLDLQASEH